MCLSIPGGSLEPPLCRSSSGRDFLMLARARARRRLLVQSMPPCAVLFLADLVP